MIDANVDTNRGTIATTLVLAAYFCVHLSLSMGYSMALAFGLLPFALFFIFFSIQSPYIPLCLLFVFNYFVMGLNRYISFPIPITNIFDLFYSLIFASILLRQIYLKNNFRNILNLYTLFSLLWLLYCTVNLGNNITGEIQAEAWLKAVRPLAIYAFATCLTISISAKHYTFIRFFLFVWGILTLLAAAKGYWQKTVGFDTEELRWLWSGGARTHLIHSGVRYFSFFTDAANYGCSMGFSSITFFIASFYTKNKIALLFFLGVSAAAFYGFLISGTRAAIAVPVAGMGLFVFLAKNWKVSVSASALLVIALFLLAFTKIGESNQLIRRMRTVFNSDDASMQVRLDNQRALKSYMAEAPFGIGIGVNQEFVLPQNKYYFVSICAPDSDLVNIWIRTGQIGLTVYLVIQFFVFLCGSYTLLFRIRNPEIRGPLAAMLCGCAGMLVASYANMVFFQFPNGPIIYACLTLVFLGPYFDKQYSAEHGKTT